MIKEYLQNSNNICIITQRKINTDDILSFIEKFSNIFSYRHLYYINVCDTKEKEQLIKDKKIKKDKNESYIFWVCKMGKGNPDEEKSKEECK